MTKLVILFALFALGISSAAAAVEWIDPTPLSTSDAASTFKTYMGEEVCIPLKIEGDTTTGNNHSIVAVTVEKPGVYPHDGSDTSLFKYPHDEINFPASGALKAQTTLSRPNDQDVETKYCFTPEAGEECIYTVCFEGEATSTKTGLKTGEKTAVPRCYRIEVHNSVLEFKGAGSKLEVPEVSNLITPQDGLTMSAWVYPKCDASSVARNETILMFGSNRDIATEFGQDKGLGNRNSIKWQEDANDQGSFFYDDCYAGAFMSAAKFCCGSWHFVSISIGEDNQGVLYVNGVGQDVLAVANSLEKLVTTAVTFETASRPDNGLDSDDAGFFRVGENFEGYVDEVHVYNRGLSAPEVDKLMTDRAPAGTVKSLTMRPAATPASWMGTNMEIVDRPYPVMVPCVMGMGHSVGPSDGSCPTEVFGWGFADSINPKVSFGGVEVRATYVSPTVLSVVTPGHISPRFVDVLASNDGKAFTDTAKVGKAAKHLYMESALYLTGSANSGAAVDSVCLDLPTRAVTFGAWVCPKCGPPVSDPPPAAAGK